MKALAFGEVLWDIYPIARYLGGASLNFAAHFKKCGGQSFINTAVGDDAFGKAAIAEIQKLGVDTSYITVSEKETGKCLVTLNDKQIPSYNLLDNVAYDYIEKPAVVNGFFDVLYFGTLALRNENNRNVLKAILSESSFDNVFVDLNIRAPYYSVDTVEFACRNATMLKVSDEELPLVMNILGETERALDKCAGILKGKFGNLKIIIITKGSCGSLAYDCQRDKFFEHKVYRVKVASTVGAGDSFSAAFLRRYLEGDDISEALEFAAKISAYVVSCVDAVPDYDLQQLDKLV